MDVYLVICGICCYTSIQEETLPSNFTVLCSCVDIYVLHSVQNYSCMFL